VFIPTSFPWFFYLFAYLLLLKTSTPPVIKSVLFGTLISVGLLASASFRFKISAHMAGISGLCGVLMAMSLTFDAPFSGLIIASVMVWGLVGYSRLKLKAHTPWEVYVGTATGFWPLFISVLLGWG
jgi:hypothetical protein